MVHRLAQLMELELAPLAGKVMKSLLAASLHKTKVHVNELTTCHYHTSFQISLYPYQGSTATEEELVTLTRCMCIVYIGIFS